MIVTEFAFYASVLLYSFFFDSRLIAIYASIIGLYYCLYLVLPSGGRLNSLRRKLQIASWSNPREGTIHASHKVDCTAANEYIASKNKSAKSPGEKVTLTHVVTKAIAQMMVFEEINGRVICGKYIPYKTVNINVLCDVDQGNDLAMIMIEEADKLSISQIAGVVNRRAMSIKQKKDTGHKKQMGSFTFMPPFLITICFDMINFFCTGLGFRLPGLGLKDGNIHGCALVTNLGPLGHVDTFAPFNIANRVVTIAAINQVADTPVVREGEVVIRKMCNLNFTVDHRFLDGGKSKKIFAALDSVFQNPAAFD